MGSKGHEGDVDQWEGPTQVSIIALNRCRSTMVKLNPTTTCQAGSRFKHRLSHRNAAQHVRQSVIFHCRPRGGENWRSKEGQFSMVVNRTERV